MPANVSIEFSKAQAKYEQAKSLTDKILALQEMRSTAPAHKGGENIRSEIARKIALTKKEIEKQRDQQKRLASTDGRTLTVKKEGVGQVTLVGCPNSGKSWLLKKLTNADVLIASYPFTTKKPVQGMMNYNNAWIQLVEIPGIITDSSKGKADGLKLLSIIRNCDAIGIVLDNNNALSELELILIELNNALIKVGKNKPKIIIKKSNFKGIQITGKKFLKTNPEKLKEFLINAGLRHCDVILEEETTLEKVADSLNPRITFKKGIILLSNKFNSKLNKKELELKKKELERIVKEKELDLKITELNEKTDWKKLNSDLFLLLEKKLVFTKKPGGKPDYNDPLVLKKNDTVRNVAKQLHKDFARNLKYVKVWGSSKFPGQRVKLDYKLKNMDVIEIYA
ncbi:MAG: GTPase [archaeon]